jgi:hypothetical protein
LLYVVFTHMLRLERARTYRNVVREFLVQKRATPRLCNSIANETLGTAFDYDYVPTIGVSGGILLGWNTDMWAVSEVTKGRFSISAKIAETGSSNTPWWITVVYGPQPDHEKVEFLDELLSFRDVHPGPWFLCGDFNMIYRAQDKNNGRLDRRCMRRFRSFLNRAHLEELHLIGRRFTWTSERERPTLELLDRMFASIEWFEAFPNHVLKPLSSDCSDHCPLLLQMHALPGTKRRFRLESFWTKLPSFLDTMAAAWTPTPRDTDPFRMLDYKFRNVAKALRAWSSAKIGSVRLQLAIARDRGDSVVG